MFKCLMPFPRCRRTLLLALRGHDRIAKDRSEDLLKAAVSAHGVLSTEADVLNTSGVDLPGWLSAAIAEGQTLLTQSSDHMILMCTTVLKAHATTLEPLAVLAPFADKSKPHWLDEFEGDIAIVNSDLIAFCIDTLFTSQPKQFHTALSNAQLAHAAALATFNLFGLMPTSDVESVEPLLLTASVTMLEGQVFGIMAELDAKPVKLKREMTKIYASTDGRVWGKLHVLIQELVE